jgi:hypothetical protein
MPSQAHHRHQFYWHWAGFPIQIPVFNCSADATTLQAAINNWNATGGFGTVFSYQGANCSPSTGIVAKVASLPPNAAGEFAPVAGSWRPHEAIKDTTQRGRMYYGGSAGMFRITRAELRVASFALYDVTVYAHELGHAIGLHEHYYDVDVASCVPYPAVTIMDCSGTDTGPSTHDRTDGTGRYDQAPWGPGAIWIHADSGTSITIKWGEINDNESGYRVMRSTAPGIGGEQQQGGIQPPDTDTFTQSVTSGQQYCYHLKVTHYLVVDGYSSQICRTTQPNQPAAPAGVSVSAGLNNYTAVLSWTQNDGGYTHPVYSCSAVWLHHSSLLSSLFWARQPVVHRHSGSERPASGNVLVLGDDMQREVQRVEPAGRV